MSILKGLEPEKVFYYFEQICNIPHGSRDTKAISDYLVSYAKERGFSYIQDELNNVIIKAPGTEGYENSEPVILQGHMDMVCEKRPDVDHDFQKDSIPIFVEDGFIKTKGTTLGGDDGIGVAFALAIMEEKSPHPPIETLITVDEELGMEGAEFVDLSVLSGKKLINLDSEEEGVLTVGCAGGTRLTGEIPFEKEPVSGRIYSVKISGLLGGHSGDDIKFQRGNASKLLARFLYEYDAVRPLRIIEFNGGSRENVIPSEADCTFVSSANAEEVQSFAIHMKETFDKEFMGDESNLAIATEPLGEKECHAMTKDSMKRVLNYLVCCPNGVYGYNRKLSGLVELSTNLGIVRTREDHLYVLHLIRSSSDSLKESLRDQINACIKMAGGIANVGSTYSAWQFNPDSNLRKVMEDAYEYQYDAKPKVETIHAGLECGLFLGKRPDLDCVAIGPDILDIHSYLERLDIASTHRSYEYLKEVLKRLK